MSVRAAPLPPATDLSRRSVIYFRHPGYSADASDYLLSLPRVDTEPAEPNKFGVHHATALLACQIIGNNAFDGYLSTSRQNPARITTTADGVLMEDAYFFIVPGNDKYPVVPSFQDWQFPHTEFEQRLWWPKITTGLDDLVGRCAVTQCAYSLEKAHLVPKNENVLCHRNRMRVHSRNLSHINNKANLLNLRIDTHRCFDNQDWVIVPKPSHSDPAFAYAVHVLGSDNPAAEFHANWHNSEVLNLQDQSRAYLFARFAWAVIQRAKSFVLEGVPRNVVRVAIDKEGTTRWVAALETGERLDELYGGGGSNGATSRKRSRITSAADSEAEAEEEDESSTYTPFDPVELDIRLEMLKRRKGEE